MAAFMQKFNGNVSLAMKPNRTHRLAAGTWTTMLWFRENTDLLMLIALAIIVVTGWLAAELADEVLEGTTQKYDEWVLRQLRTPGDLTDPVGPEGFGEMWGE